MDLAELLRPSEDGVDMPLKNPYAEGFVLKADGTPATIRLAGKDSKRWRKAEDAVGNRMLKAAKPGKGFVYGSMDEQREDAATMLAHVTISWDGIIFGGEPWPCNFENAKRLYLLHPGIKEQVDQFVADRANFSTASSQN